MEIILRTESPVYIKITPWHHAIALCATADGGYKMLSLKKRFISIKLAGLVMAMSPTLSANGSNNLDKETKQELMKAGIQLALLGVTLGASIYASMKATDAFGKMDINMSPPALPDDYDEKELPAEVAAVIHEYKNPNLYEKYGDDPSTEILLHGPPGNGKTLCAKYIARSQNVPMLKITPGDFMQKFLGTAVPNIRMLFKQARDIAAGGKTERLSNGFWSMCGYDIDRPLIRVVLFIDELDGIGQRSELSGSNTESQHIINALLDEIGDPVKNDGVLIIAATNYIHSIDPALLRDGRLGRHIEFHHPTQEVAQKTLTKLVAKENEKLSSCGDLTISISDRDIEETIRAVGEISISRIHSLIKRAKEIHKEEMYLSLTREDTHPAGAGSGAASAAGSAEAPTNNRITREHFMKAVKKLKSDSDGTGEMPAGAAGMYT